MKNYLKHIFILLFSITYSYSIAQTQLQPADCGAVNVAFNQIIQANTVPGATTYNFRVENAGLGLSEIVSSQNRNFRLNDMIAQPQLATTYDITIQTVGNSGTSVFGAVCQITTPPLTYDTQLSSTNCGITLTSFDQVIYVDQVAGATKYEIEVRQGGNVIGSEFGPNPTFQLNTIPNLDYNTTYQVVARIRTNQWQSYSVACDVTTPSLPVPTIATCNVSFPGTNGAKYIYYSNDYGVDHYEFEMIDMVDGSLHTDMDHNGSPTSLNAFPLPNNEKQRMYELKGRIHTTNGTIGPWSAICHIYVGLANLPTCVVATTGTTVTLDADVPFETYRWYFNNNLIVGAINQSLDVTVPGNYTVEVDYQHIWSGVSSSTTTVSFGNGPVADLGIDIVKCNDPSITTLDPGNFVSYEWSTGETTPTIDVSTSGIYSVATIDIDGCTSYDEIQVTYSSIQLAISTEIRCTNDGQATVVASGGTAPYTYAWDDQLLQSTATAINLSAGTYTVTVTDVNGCTATQPIVIETSTCAQLHTTVCNTTHDNTITFMHSTPRLGPSVEGHLWKYTTTYNGNDYTHFYFQNSTGLYYYYAAYVGGATDGNVTNGIYTPGAPVGAATGLIYGTTYQVSIRNVTSLDQAGNPVNVGPEGPICNITFENPSATLKGGCGNTYNNTYTFIDSYGLANGTLSHSIGGAYEYDFNFYVQSTSTGAVDASITRSGQNPFYFYAAWVPLQYKTLYNVEIIAHIIDYDGAILNSTPNPCTIEFGEAIPEPNICNVTSPISFQSYPLSISPRIGGAVGYRWYFDDGLSVETLDYSGPFFYGSWAGFLAPGIYDVWAEAFTDASNPSGSLLTVANPIKCTVEFISTARMQTNTSIVSYDQEEKNFIPENSENYLNINSLNPVSQINTFPNPTSGSFTLNIIDEQLVKFVTVMDMLGKIVYSESVPRQTNYTNTIDLSMYEKGIYLIQVQFENKMEVRKVVYQ